MQSNFHHNVSNGSIPLGKNGKALSKNKQKIQKYKRKRKQGTCFTCDSSEHQIAQCPIKKFLKSLKTNKSSFSKDFVNQEVCNRPTPCNYDGSSNGQFIQRDHILTLPSINPDENPNIKSIRKDAVMEPPSTSVKDVIYSAPIQSNFLDPSNSSMGINNTLELEEIRSLKLPESQTIPLDLDALGDGIFDFGEILKNFDMDSEQDIPMQKESSTKPLQFNKRDPRLLRSSREKICN